MTLFHATTINKRHNQIRSTPVLPAFVVLLLLLLSDHGRLLVGGAPAQAPPASQLSPSDAAAVAAASQVLLTELLAVNTNNNVFYNEMQKYAQRQQAPQHYLSKWPGLRDLLLTAADYEDNNNALESNEVTNSRFLQRLRQLAENSAGDLIEDARDESGGYNNNNNSNNNQLSGGAAVTAAKTFKDHGTKKNAQYMSPCHFKICNMGRKRNARLHEY